MDKICQKCKKQCTYFARSCSSVAVWTCGACEKARKEAAKRYAAKYNTEWGGLTR